MDKLMAGDYEIIHAFHVGDKEIVIGENVNAHGDERYMCAYCEKNEILGLTAIFGSAMTSVKSLRYTQTDFRNRQRKPVWLCSHPSSRALILHR